VVLVPRRVHHRLTHCAPSIVKTAHLLFLLEKRIVVEVGTAGGLDVQSVMLILLVGGLATVAGLLESVLVDFARRQGIQRVCRHLMVRGCELVCR